MIYRQNDVSNLLHLTMVKSNGLSNINVDVQLIIACRMGLYQHMINGMARLVLGMGDREYLGAHYHTAGAKITPCEIMIIITSTE